MISDKIDKYFTVISEFMNAREKDFINFGFVLHCHILPSVIPFIAYLLKSGLPANNIYLIGKPYSTIDRALFILQEMDINVILTHASYPHGLYESYINTQLQNMWVQYKERLQVHSKLILMDSGGELRRSYPYEKEGYRNRDIKCVELTTNGISQKYKIPVIEMALASVKKQHESPIIAKAIISALEKKSILSTTKTFGVIGYGAIGMAIHNELLKYDKKVQIFEISNKNHKNSLGNVPLPECVIGCTGCDSMNRFLWDKIDNDILLVSASSKDVEYQTVIRKYLDQIKSQTIFSDIVVHNKNNAKITLLNSGYPMNFNRGSEFEPMEDIMLTRGLWLLAILYAVKSQYQPIPEFKISLPEEYQKYIYKSWLEIFKSD